MNILIVDDEKSVRDVMVELLGAIRDKHPSLPELHMQMAENGAMGAQKVLWLELDLVLTDFLMPRMDGLRMTRGIRRRGFKGPVVMLTSLADEKEKEAKKAGVTEIHMKPVTFHLLENIVLRFRQKMLEERYFTPSSGTEREGP